jgi:hypothetical protein
MTRRACVSGRVGVSPAVSGVPPETLHPLIVRHLQKGIIRSRYDAVESPPWSGSSIRGSISPMRESISCTREETAVLRGEDSLLLEETAFRWKRFHPRGRKQHSEKWKQHSRFRKQHSPFWKKHSCLWKLHSVGVDLHEVRAAIAPSIAMDIARLVGAGQHVALITALAAEGVWAVVSWLLLCLPLAIVGWPFFRKSIGSRTPR